MNVYQALLRDGKERRENATEHALFQAQEAAKDLAQREQKLSAALAALLPGTYYMDPPDGGSVALLEQLRRMAKDAERYRQSLVTITPQTMRQAVAQCERELPSFCDNCLTEDACNVRGMCAHTLREQGAQRAQAQPCNRFSREQIMDAMIESEVSDGAFKTMLLKMDELEAQARQTLAGRERPNVSR